MQILQLIKRADNGDIYDYLADYMDIDLLECDSPSTLLTMLNEESRKQESIMDNLDDTEIEYKQAEEESARLAMIKGFINILLYTQDSKFIDDKFFGGIFTDANDTHLRVHGFTIAQETLDTFRDLDIRTTDDLADNEDEFNNREYCAFEDALELHESFKRI